MRSERRKKMTILIMLLIGVCSISIGFAAYSTNLKIESGLAISPDESAFSVKFSSSATSLATDPVSPSSKSEGLETTDATIANSTKPTISGYSATFTKNGQYVTYSFYVRNTGHYIAYLNSISFNGEKTCAAKPGTSESEASANCDNVSTKATVKIGNITTTESMADITGETLSPNESKLVEVTFEYISGGNFVGGDFSIEFPSISLYYASTGGINGTPGTESDKVLLTSNTHDLVLSDLSNKQLENYRIYGSRDGVGDPTNNGYVIPVSVRGINLANLSKAVVSTSTPNTTFSYDNSTGTIELTSTPRTYDYVILQVNRDLEAKLDSGKTYYYSGDVTISGKTTSDRSSILFSITHDSGSVGTALNYNTNIAKNIKRTLNYTESMGIVNLNMNFNYGSLEPAQVKYENIYFSEFDRYEPFVIPTKFEIILSKPLMEGDCIDFKTQTVVRRDGTKENISIPAITTLSVPTTVIDVTSENPPSMIEASYFK